MKRIKDKVWYVSMIADEIIKKVNKVDDKWKYVPFVFFVFITIMSVWLSDDAFHAFVMAKNLIMGRGFVYNIGTRVNATTAPLYTLILAIGYYVIRDIWLVTYISNVVFSGIAVFILIKYFCKSFFQFSLYLNISRKSC